MADTVAAIGGLTIIVGVKVKVVQNDDICARQADTKASCSCREQKDLVGHVTIKETAKINNLFVQSEPSTLLCAVNQIALIYEQRISLPLLKVHRGQTSLLIIFEIFPLTPSSSSHGNLTCTSLPHNSHTNAPNITDNSHPFSVPASTIENR